MKLALGQDAISNINMFTDDEIVFIMEKVNPFAMIDELSSFFAAYPDRAIKIRDALMKRYSVLPLWYVLSFSKTTEKRPELMGIFGFSWQEKIINFMKRRLKGTASVKILSDFWGENTKLADNLHKQYLLELSQGSIPVSFTAAPDSKGDGGTPAAESDILAATLSSKTGIDKEVTEEFLRALYCLARDGKIDYKLLNPQDYQKAVTAAKSFEPQNVIERIATSGKTLLFLGGLVTAAYLYNSFKDKKK